MQSVQTQNALISSSLWLVVVVVVVVDDVVVVVVVVVPVPVPVPVPVIVASYFLNEKGALIILLPWT